MGYDDKVREIRAKLELDKKSEAREQLHMKELEEQVVPVLIEHDLTTDNVIHLADLDELPAHIIVRKPTDAEYQIFRTTLHKDSAQRGVVEAKAKAGAALASRCLVYPDREAYLKLVKENNAVSDAVAKKCVHLAEAGAAELEKD